MRILVFFFALSAFAAEERWVEADGARLYCRSAGKGSPVIVIHGGPGLSHDYLLPQMDRLAEKHLVIFYDQRGSGRSEGEIDSGEITAESFVKDLDAVRRGFGLEKVSILGHSWGGFIAMQYAIAHPEAVEKLILSNSMPADTEGFSLFVQQWMERTAPFGQEMAEIQSNPLFQSGDPVLVKRFHHLVFGSYCFDPKKADLLSLDVEPEAWVRGSLVYQFASENILLTGFDLKEELRQLAIDALVLSGDSDPVPASTGKTLHECISGSRFITMKNCGHFPYVEDPEAFFGEIEAFLKED